jgi:hypothetical protein
MTQELQQLQQKLQQLQQQLRQLQQQKEPKHYLRVADLKTRWRVSTMFIERITRQPGFPKAIRMPGSRIRLFAEDEIEAYEKAAIVAPREARL